MKKANTIICTCIFLVSTCVVAEAPIEGYWKSIDDQTNSITAYWKIEIEDEHLRGYIVNYPDAKPDDVCIECTGELDEFFEKPVRGTAWLDLSNNDNGEWNDGYIIDSGKGEKYKARVWLDEGKLMMRGYIGFFFRTQTWLRTNQADAEQGVF
jgi:uncharacterized protein (DUF2147 family)